MGLSSVKIDTSAAPDSRETLKIDRKAGKICADVWGYAYVDKDTKQQVLYLPSFEISGYGESFESAEEMVRFSINEFFNYLNHLPEDKMHAELRALGWSRSKLFRKELSKVTVNQDGILQGLNAEAGTIKSFTLAAV